MFEEEISAIENKLSTLHKDNRKDSLRTSNVLVELGAQKAQGCKRVNSFVTLCFEKRTLGILLPLCQPESCVLRNYFTMLSYIGPQNLF